MVRDKCYNGLRTGSSGGEQSTLERVKWCLPEGENLQLKKGEILVYLRVGLTME